MLEISEKFNSGKFKDVWTCENFYLDPYNFYPNWPFLKGQGCTDGWNTVNARYAEIQKEGKDHIETIKQLHKEKLIEFHENPNSNKIHGFTKVQGNEFNSAIIMTALIELSKRIKTATITLSDEGRFLYCDVRIKNGLVQPILSEARETIDYHCRRIVMANKSIVNQFEKGELAEGLLKDLGFEAGYDKASSIQYINDTLRDLNELYARIKGHITANYHCIHNIEQEWFPAHLLCRPVKAEDFAEFEGGPAQLMGGFYGEYWKLTGKDAEAESYRSIGMIQKMLGEDLAKHMEVLPKLGK